MRENELRHKFDVDKYKNSMDQKFKSLIGTREQEWEKAWEKREDVIVSKDRKVRELENERTTLKDTLSRKEFELESLSNQVNTMIKDHQKQVEDFKQRLQTADKKYDDILKQYRKHEETLSQSSKDQLIQVKESLTTQFNDDIRKLNDQLTETKEKNKRKQNELSIQIHDLSAKHSQEVTDLKQSYDEMFHRLEIDLEAKKDLSNELQN